MFLSGGIPLVPSESRLCSHLAGLPGISQGLQGGGGRNSEFLLWPEEAPESSFFPKRMFLGQAIWFTRRDAGEHLVLPLTWIRAKSEEEKNNNNTAWGCQACALTVASTGPSSLHCSISSSTPVL